MPSNNVPDDRCSDADTKALHLLFVEQLKATGVFKNERIEAAFREVPRHLFLSDFPPEQIYKDEAIPTKIEDERLLSSSSQPSLMAIMLGQLNLRPGHQVLEIGAGTGYNAALMAHIVGESGRVTTVDLDEDIADGARRNLLATGFGSVRVVCGDGMVGYGPNAPYDRLILTVGGWDIPPEWLAQLEPDGRMLLPLSINGPQYSIALEREGDHLAGVSITECGFMRIRGQFAEPQSMIQLGPEPGISLEFNSELPNIDAEAIFGWLMGTSRYWDTGLTVTLREVWGGFGLWQALHERQRCLLAAQGSAADSGIVPFLFGSNDKRKLRLTYLKLGEAGISVLSPPPGEASPLALAYALGKPPPSFSLYVHGFGPDDQVALDLMAQVRAWNEAGRPGTEGLRLRAYPVSRGYTPEPVEYMVTRRWMDFVIDWPQQRVIN